MANESNADAAATLVADNSVAARVRADPFVLLNAMPAALFVIDGAADVVFANDRLLELIRQERHEVIGRSALDFLDPRDIEFAASLLVSSADFVDTLMGPNRVRYLDVDGVSHYTHFWASAAPPELGVTGGFILTLTPESVRDVLATAVTSVATDESLDRTLLAIATAGRAMPLDGLGTVLVVSSQNPSDTDRFRVVGKWPVAPELLNAYGTPWRRCLVQNGPQDVFDASLGDVDARTGAEMVMAGFPSAWVRPICDALGDVAGVFIVWRRNRRATSPNQESHLSDSARLAHLALEQDRHRCELEYAAHRDALTGVRNRASLNDRMEQGGLPTAVLFIDLDRFKAVNDTFGHAVGDEVIAHAGRRIADVVRPGDEVYRTGGDEFIVVCDPELVDDADLFALAERLIERMAAPFDSSSHRVRIGATVGIASGRPKPGIERTLSETILVADRAMYVAKDRGRGCVHHADVQH